MNLIQIEFHSEKVSRLDHILGQGLCGITNPA